jgi:hypothetical protein
LARYVEPDGHPKRPTADAVISHLLVRLPFMWLSQRPHFGTVMPRWRGRSTHQKSRQVTGGAPQNSPTGSFLLEPVLATSITENRLLSCGDLRACFHNNFSFISQLLLKGHSQQRKNLPMGSP